MKSKKEIIHLGNDDRCDTCFNEGIKQERKRILNIINKLEEPSNRFNLGLNNQEALAYFDGFSDTKKELKQKISERENG